MDAGKDTLMSHIATRQSGTMSYQFEGETRYARVSAIVVNQGVFIAEVFATSKDNDDYVELDDPVDLLLNVKALNWYESGKQDDPEA